MVKKPVKNKDVFKTCMIQVLKTCLVKNVSKNGQKSSKTGFCKGSYVNAQCAHLYDWAEPTSF